MTPAEESDVMRRFSLADRLVFVSAAFLLGACGGWDGDTGSAVRVDTLPGGGLHVRSPAQGEWEPEEGTPWRIVEELRIGAVDGEGPEVFGRVRSVIPDAQGRMWVMDSQAFELRLFDADGNFVRVVGGPGEGPGEFAMSPCTFPGPDGEIWVEDMLRRWQRFDSAGNYLGSHPVTSNLGCGIRRWTPDGRFLVVNTVRDPQPSSTGFYVVHRLEEGGQLVPGDTIHPPELSPPPLVTWVSADGRGRITMPLPFAPRPARVLAASGDFWVADGDGPYVIRRESAEGDTLLVIERDYEPIPIPASVRDEAIRDFRRDGMTPEGGFDPNDVPRFYPAFESFQTGPDGALWVWRQLAEGEVGLDVFTPDGRYLGQAQTPADFDRMTIHTITRDHLYGIVRDELDVPYVVRLGIRRPGG